MPLTPAEQRIPVGVVSNSYSLIQHRDVAELCREALTEGGLSVDALKCELGLTPLGEYMVFRAYAPDNHGFKAKDGLKTSLRLECINSVDGTHRLVAFYSWLRLVCQNGMMVRDTKTEVREVHNHTLDLESVSRAITHGLSRAAADVRRLEEWDDANVDLVRFRGWVDEDLASRWKKKAASRVYHLAMTGCDSQWVDPFEGGPATSRDVVRLAQVPGAAACAGTFYDILQALTWVASQRQNLEERIQWQSEIPSLMESVQSKAAAASRWAL
jgi:uncharacterized protein DUF932